MKNVKKKIQNAIREISTRLSVSRDIIDIAAQKTEKYYKTDSELRATLHELNYLLNTLYAAQKDGEEILETLERLAAALDCAPGDLI